MSKSPLPIYVLSVKTFTDRINHIQQEMTKHCLSFEFIFDHDIYDITDEINKKYFASDSNLTPAAKSITLKHITAWEKALFHQHQQILVLEDDVVLAPNFTDELVEILHNLKKITPGYLIFLGGADTKAPKEFFKNSREFYQLNMSTAEAYITDLEAIKARLAWLDQNKISLPADHATVKIDQDCSNIQYWPKKPLVTQGSVLGLFRTTLDINRAKKYPLTNRMLFEWRKFKRRTLPQLYYDAIKFLNKI